MFLRVIGKSILGFLALAGCFCITAQSALAAPDPAVSCVQNQAQHLKITTGIIDGFMGPKTRKASHALAQEYPSLKDLRALTRDNAIVWCREIGLLDETQTQYWPVKTAPKFEFLFSSFLTNRQHTELQNAVAFAHRYFTRYDIHLAGSIKIIASPNEAELAKHLAANSRYPMRRSTARLIIREQCRGEDISGLNTPGIVALCFGPDHDWDQSYIILRRLITHEISHEIQRQMSGYTSLAIASNEQLLQRMGPRWLIEGSAIALELDALFPYVQANEHIEALRADHGEYSGKKLAKLLFYDAPSEQYFGEYAALAGQMLANRNQGITEYFTYWNLLARMDWRDAFSQVFGLTPEVFYDEFNQSKPTKVDQSAQLSGSDT